jgi:SAM-dependent methyltransferase
VLLLNAGTGSVIAALTELADAPTVITVVDPSREALSFLDTDVAPVDARIQVIAQQENLAEFAVGRLRHTYPPQDVIVLHGLLEYLPDRLAVSLLGQCAALLNHQGAVVSAALAESADQHLLDRLLRWPTLAPVHRRAWCVCTKRPAFDPNR